MKKNMSEILDVAIEQLLEKQSIPDILQRYPNQAQDLLSLLQTVETLTSVHPVKMPSYDVMQADRNAFLHNIAQPKCQTVSPGLLARIKGWSGSLIRWPQINLPSIRKEKWNMSAILVRAVLVIGLLFGAAGGAYAMADNSLPNEPMYGAKLAMEQFQLERTSDPAKIAAQHLMMAQNRVQEVVRLAQKGNTPDSGTMTRLEQHLNLALQFMAQLGNEGEMLGMLTQARLMAQEQIQAMTRIQVNGEDPLQEPLRLALRLLNQFQNQVEAGLQNPQAFQWQYQNGQYGNPDAPGQPGGNPDCPLDECVPEGDQNQYGQTDEGAPGQPGGNPDCPLDECVPEGDQNQYGQTDEDAPGQPGGNPDCPNSLSEASVPEGDENKYGPKPDQPGPGLPGGNPDCPNCPCEDCEPEGDENQYGPQPDQPGPGLPGGNPDCPTDDCVPSGDQNGPNNP